MNVNDGRIEELAKLEGELADWVGIDMNDATEKERREMQVQIDRLHTKLEKQLHNERVKRGIMDETDYSMMSRNQQKRLRKKLRKKYHK